MEEALTYINQGQIQDSVAGKLNINQIIKDYSSRLKGFIRNTVSSADDAEDILQDVFFQLIEAESKTRPIEQLTSWLFTVTRNKIIDFSRKKKTESLPEYFVDSDDESLTELREIMFNDGSTPETDYLRSLVWKELNKALEELPEEQKIVFEMNEIKGISFKEISEQTGETVNTLISRKRYAVLHLRKRLQVLYDELINF
jgi:RNA polymerase sigma factor (sigma-70 family)